MRIQLALDPVAACAVGEPLRAAGHDVTEWEDPQQLTANPGDAVFLGGREAALLCRSVRDAGVDEYIVKPLDRAELLRAVSRHLREGHADPARP